MCAHLCICIGALGGPTSAQDGSLRVGVTGVAGSVNHLAWVLGAKLSPLESDALSNH